MKYIHGYLYLLGLALPFTIGAGVGDATNPGLGVIAGLISAPFTMLAAWIVSSLITVAQIAAAEHKTAAFQRRQAARPPSNRP